MVDPFDIGGDPGFSTGLVVFQGGRFVWRQTIEAPQRPKEAGRKVPGGLRRGQERDGIALQHSARIVVLKKGLEAFFAELKLVYRLLSAGQDPVPFPIRFVAVETFGNYVPQARARSMMTCSQARAILIAVASDYCQEIIDVSSGPKADADVFARHYGLPLDRKFQHERDALLVAINAGFDRPRRAACK